MEHQQLTDAEFAEFQKLIFRLCGIQVPANKVMLLSNRIRRRLRATGTAGYADYLRLLKTRAGNDELAHFLDAITTNETSFFRTEKQFQWLQSEFLDDVCGRIRNGSHPATLRLWSAACSTGQEPGTMAICLAEQSVRLRGVDIRIDATDLSEQALSVARSGTWEARALEGIPEPLRKKYFQEVAVGDAADISPDPLRRPFQVRPALRQWMHVARHNLMEPAPHTNYDCIFLRNVMIYFSAESKQVVAGHLIRALAAGGYLVIGPSEGLSEQLQGLHRRSPFVYQKAIGGAA